MEALPELIQAAASAELSGDVHEQRAAKAALRGALSVTLPRDPLLAAACLPYLPPGALYDAVSAVAAQAAPRAASARALVVDPQGKGRVIEVVVSLSPGGRGAWTPQPAARDTLIAAQLAVAAALGGEAGQWGARWQVRDPDVALRGSSVGLAVAVAARAALLQRAVPQTWAFTGGVDLDGQLAAVSGLPAKVRAAAEAGVGDVAVPAASRQPRRVPEGVTLHPLAGLAPLLQQLLPASAPAPRAPTVAVKPARAGLLLVAPLLVWLGATDAVESLLHAGLLRATRSPIPADNTVILPFPAGVEVPALRGRYAQIIAGLAEAGARAVAFDVLLLRSDAEVDPGLAAAISASPIPVILPGRVSVEGEGFQPPSAPLAAASRPALIDLEPDGLLGVCRRVRVRRPMPDRDVVWHLSVEAAGAYLGAAPALSERGLQVGNTRNPVRAERLYLPPVEDSPRLSWEDSASWSAAAGRVVLVGSLSDRKDRFRTPNGARYGVEVHAAMTEAILQQRAPRLPAPEPSTLATLLVGAAAAGLAAVLPQRRLAVAITSAVVLIVAVAWADEVVLPVLAPLLAAALGAGVVGRRLRP